MYLKGLLLHYINPNVFIHSLIADPLLGAGKLIQKKRKVWQPTFGITHCRLPSEAEMPIKQMTKCNDRLRGKFSRGGWEHIPFFLKTKMVTPSSPVELFRTNIWLEQLWTCVIDKVPLIDKTMWIQNRSCHRIWYIWYKIEAANRYKNDRCLGSGKRLHKVWSMQ